MPYYKYQPQSVLENSNCKLYRDRYIITDRNIHINRRDKFILDKTIKEAHLNKCSNSWEWQHTHREAPVYRLERRAYKNTATENGLYNTISTIHNGDRIPVGARFFAAVQTGPGAHPAPYKMGTGSLSRG
jgi:hypothetical protein